MSGQWLLGARLQKRSNEAEAVDLQREVSELRPIFGLHPRRLMNKMLYPI